MNSHPHRAGRLADDLRDGRHVEAGDQLLIWTRRGVREHRFAELRLHSVKLDVLDEQHRALAERRHRLVGRVGLIDTQANLAWIGNQASLHQEFIGRVLAEFGLLLNNAWAMGLRTPVDAYGPAGMRRLADGFWDAYRFDIETRMADEGRPDLRKLVAVHEYTEGPVMAAGSISQATRGLASLPMNSSTEALPTAPSPASAATLAGAMS